MTDLVEQAVDRLRLAGVNLTPGLTPAEFARIEQAFGFRFNSDHHALLTHTVPTGERWVDWRDGSSTELCGRLDWPVDGVICDVHNNAFWPSSWGKRPSDSVEAERQAREHLAHVPKLVPIYSHRYLPAAPAPVPSPVLSVYQTDVIYYGDNLVDYVAHEFKAGPLQPAPGGRVERVEFWSDLIEGVEL